MAKLLTSPGTDISFHPWGWSAPGQPAQPWVKHEKRIISEGPGCFLVTSAADVGWGQVVILVARRQQDVTSGYILASASLQVKSFCSTWPRCSSMFNPFSSHVSLGDSPRGTSTNMVNL